MAKRVAKKTAVPEYTPCMLKFIADDGDVYYEWPTTLKEETDTAVQWGNDHSIVRVEKYSLSLAAVAVRHKSPFTFTNVEKS